MRRTEEQFRAEIFRRKEILERKERRRRYAFVSAAASLASCLVLLCVFVFPSFFGGNGNSEESAGISDVTVSVGSVVWTEENDVSLRAQLLEDYRGMASVNTSLPELDNNELTGSDSSVQSTVSGGTAVDGPVDGDNSVTAPLPVHREPLQIVVSQFGTQFYYTLYSDRLETDRGSVILSPSQSQELWELFSVPVSSDSASFRATVIRAESSGILVRGEDSNEINYRGEFWLTVSETTVLMRSGCVVSAVEFREGDPVTVTFTGPVMESYPMQISQVVSVRTAS